MRQIMVTDKEYDKLIKRLEFYDTTRNNLLTFSFTAVLAVLGVTMGLKVDSFSAYICLLPFLLIMPFAARIAYYRLASIHINSFLRTFRKDEMQFELGTNEVKEDEGKCYVLIAWLVNHEMVMLAFATSITFYYKYIMTVTKWFFWNYLMLAVPIFLTIIVFVIADSTNHYIDLMKRFEKQWDKYGKVNEDKG